MAVAEPRCRGCGEALRVGDERVLVGADAFHPAHFACSECGARLDASRFYRKEGRFFCAADFERRFCPECAGCGRRVVEGQVLHALGRAFHPACFVCAQPGCTASLASGSHYVHDGRAYCHAHITALRGGVAAPRCAACGRAVEGERVRVGERAYHAACLSCCVCGARLSDEDLQWAMRGGDAAAAGGRGRRGSAVFARGGLLYCKADYFSLFSQRCAACGEFILQSCVAGAAPGEAFHPQCLRCQVCGAACAPPAASARLCCALHASAPAPAPVDCSACGRAIAADDAAVLANGLRLHAGCFRCAGCGAALQRGAAKVKRGQLSCVACLEEDVRQSQAQQQQQPQPPPQQGLVPPQSPLARTAQVSNAHKPSLDFAAAFPGGALQGLAAPSDADASRPAPPRRRAPTRPSQLQLGRRATPTRAELEAANKAAAAAAGVADPSSDSEAMSASPSPSPRPPTSPRSPVAARPEPLVAPAAAAAAAAEAKAVPPSPSQGEATAEGEAEARIVWRRGELLGKGSFGKVFQALNVNTGEMIAVKQITLADADPRSSQLIESEIALMKHLRHPNIVTLLGVERVGRKLNILMEFVPGNSLATLLERYGPLTENVARSYARQLVSAVAFCHTHNVVHRDIKGKNVLVDTLGRLKLADFGSAKQFADAVAKDNASLTFNYTPLWTAPEVLTGSYNAKVDVWSLGCVLLEMFTARPPWAEHNLDNPFRAIYHIGSTNATPRLPDSASPAARDFMSRCLTRDPDARWSAEQLAAHPWLAAPSRPSSPPASPRAAATASAVARAPGPAPAAPPEENSSDNEGEGEGGSS